MSQTEIVVCKFFQFGRVENFNILDKKETQGTLNMQHNYFISWPRIMKIGQIDVLFAVTRSKMKHRVTYKNSFKDYSLPGVSFSS